jgi:hypothetical protein
MAEIRPFVLIQDWMFDLGLNLSEVIAVAVIYGFTQDGMHTCHASLPYFQRRCCVNKRNAIRVLSKLEKMGLLTVGRKAGEQNEYSLNLEVVSKRHQCQNDTSVKIAQSGVKMTPLSPTPPIPIRKDNKKNITSACDAHVCTHEGGSERPPQATPQPPSPPVPSKDEVGLFYVSSMEREAVGFSRDRIAGSEAIRAEGDPYFSLYAKAKLWIDIDASRAAAKTAGNSESQFKDATSDWKNRGDF